MGSVLLEARPFRPFKSSEEYLYAMKEDLAEWLQMMYPHLNIDVDNFFERLETGVALCEHANAVKAQAYEYVEKKQARKVMTRSATSSLSQAQALIRIMDVKYFNTAKPGTFFARDNVSNFINWCRHSLRILECLLFESDDLIMRKNEKHVILCLLEVARRGAKFGMLAPMLVQMERQIDREIAADQKKMAVNEGVEDQNGVDDDTDSEFEEEEPVLMYGPVPQIVTNDLKSLDEMVRDLVEKCTCPTQFPMIRVSEGKYRIGDTKVLIFVRILRNHVMVRVGGGWDTLSHYLDKHDPCRCRSQHRSTQGARLVNRPGAADLQGAQVFYERSPQPASLPHIPPAGSPHHSLGPPTNSLNRSRSRSPSYLSQPDQSRRSLSPRAPRKSLAPPGGGRSRSPTPHYTSTAVARLAAGGKRGGDKEKGGARGGAKHVVAVQIPVEAKIMKSETVLQVNDTDHSDTTSEMSDEGYRSLGIVQDKTKQRSSVYSQNSAEDVEENEHHNLCTEEELNDIGLRKTQFSQRIYEGDPKKSPQPQKSKVAPQNDQPRKERSLSKENSFERPPLSRANSSDSGETPKNSPRRTPLVSKKMESKTNTWNGRAKGVRASINPDTFSPQFQRNSTGRRSVSAVREDRRSSSANTSPTKGKLRQELLNTVKKDTDEQTIVLKVQELLKKYGSLSTLNDDINDIPVRFDRKSCDRMSYRSPRKDSRPENNISRIPAPVSYKT